MKFKQYQVTILVAVKDSNTNYTKEIVDSVMQYNGSEIVTYDRVLSIKPYKQKSETRTKTSAQTFTSA